MSTLITGQQWIPLGYFQFYYEPDIRKAFAEGKTFALGAGGNTDNFAQQLLAHLCKTSGDETSFKRVTIFNKGDKDGRVDARFNLVNGFDSYPNRGVQMAARCKDRICHLAQWGGGVCGSLIELQVMQILEEGPHEGAPTPQEAFVRSDKVLSLVRGASETWNADWLESEIIPMYKRLYPAKPAGVIYNEWE